jgi:hypothetical protein
MVAATNRGNPGVAESGPLSRSGGGGVEFDFWLLAALLGAALIGIGKLLEQFGGPKSDTGNDKWWWFIR